ncbi:hypothetical protein [Lysobacter xanthus]
MNSRAEASGRRPAVVASRALLVLGMHRSGTSAVAGALARCGVALGDRLIEGAPDNPGGYFEHADAVLADERVLLELGRAWDDVRPMPIDWLDSAPAQAAAAAIRSTVVSPLCRERLWALKDPRMCRLLPLWRRTLEAEGVEPLGLLVLRHPDEVAQSLRTRDAMHARTANMLWLRHVLEAARDAPERTETLTYDAFLVDPAACLGRVTRGLGLDLTVDPNALGAFVDRGARHHTVEGATARDAIHALALDTHRALAESSWRESLPGLLERLEAVVDADAPWVDALGAAAFGAERRRGAAIDARLSAERRAEQLQAAVDRASAIAIERAGELAALDLRNRDLQDALGRAESLVTQQSQASKELDRRLGDALAGLARAESLVARESEVSAELDRRLGDALAGLARAESLVARESEVSAELDRRLGDALAGLARAESLVARESEASAELDRRLGDALAGLARAESLVAAQGLELRVAEDRLKAADAGLAKAESLARERANEVVSLNARVAEAERALRAAESLVDSHAAQASALEVAKAHAEAIAQERMIALGDLEQAKSAAERFAHERLQRIHELAAARDAADDLALRRLELAESLQAELDVRSRRIDELGALVSRLEIDSRELERIRGSRWWPVFARLIGVGPIDV